ncbi:ankyrin repeat and fibronectin type-III domain-containing protein 1 isoform X2 [Amia ocellicauda]
MLSGAKVGTAGQRGWRSEVNALSSDGLVPLDVAALTLNSALLRILSRAGARENPHLCSAAQWSMKLQEVVRSAGGRVGELRRVVCEGPGPAGGPQVGDHQRELRVWTLRHQLYSRMRDSFHCTVLPGPPTNVCILVSSATSLSVSFREPRGTSFGLITRYRVEWSRSATFDPPSSSALVHDTKNLYFTISGLYTGVPYFIRVSAYNVRGWGPAQPCSPPCAAPSSWTQCSSVKLRSREGAAAVRRLLEQIRDPQYSGYNIEAAKAPSPSKRVSVSRSLKLLFQSATKFVRSLQRGVYLTTVFYDKDNVLVTAEEQLPLVEIHSCSTSVTQDFLWFAKLSCVWQFVPWLQQAMGSTLSSSSSLLQTRQKILLAVSQLQGSLGVVDLGQVYHEPIKDRQGNLLLVTLREHGGGAPPDPLHWAPLSRLHRERHHNHLLHEPTAIDTLTENIRDQLCYHRRSVQCARPGLYVGVLKLCSSVDQIRVLVPLRLPNLLCHSRVRHNPHVSREEWAWLQGLCVSDRAEEGAGQAEGVLAEFVRSLRAAITHLLTKLSIPLCQAQHYRLYTQEVLQFGEQVSFLLLLPPSEEFCASPGGEGAPSGFLTLPLQIFELVHFSVYDPEFFSQFCQASLLLELEAQLSQQALREALDKKEVSEARARLEQVQQLSQRVDELWRGVRWITDALHCARYKHGAPGAPLGRILDEPVTTETTPAPEAPPPQTSIPLPNNKIDCRGSESDNGCCTGRAEGSDPPEPWTCDVGEPRRERPGPQPSHRGQAGVGDGAIPEPGTSGSTHSSYKDWSQTELQHSDSRVSSCRDLGHLEPGRSKSGQSRTEDWMQAEQESTEHSQSRLKDARPELGSSDISGESSCRELGQAEPGSRDGGETQQLGGQSQVQLGPETTDHTKSSIKGCDWPTLGKRPTVSQSELEPRTVGACGDCGPVLRLTGFLVPEPAAETGPRLGREAGGLDVCVQPVGQDRYRTQSNKRSTQPPLPTSPLPPSSPPAPMPSSCPTTLPRCDSQGEPVTCRGRSLPERSLVEWISSPSQS